MRVLLVIPTSNYNYSYPSFLAASDFPTGLAFLASSLKQAGHEVFGLNPNNDVNYQSAYEMVYDKIDRKLKETKPQLIGLGGLCTDFHFIRDAMQIIRKLAPDVPIVLGGGVINHDTEYVFKLLRPDFCIAGEGEETIVQLSNMLHSGKPDYDQIENLGYWKDNVAVFTRPNFDYIDINERPFPDYEPFDIHNTLDNYSLAARNLYRYTRPEPRPMVIVTARGCPFSCTFCVHHGGPRYRARSIDNIMQEIEEMYERYHFNILIVLDELFAVNKARLEEFCNSLIEAKINRGWDFDWMFQTHASAGLDVNSLNLAKKSGCYFFSYGLESASPTVLASMNKKIKIPQIIGAIDAAKSAEIGFGGNFIFGDPAETETTIAETMNFFSQYCADSYISLVTIQPYPGSKLFDGLVQKGKIKDKSLYYEKIGAITWNMTSIPDRLWLPWAYLLQVYSQSYSWVKSTDATQCKEEYSAAGNPMISQHSRLLQIWAKCPHCGKDVYYREIAGKAQGTKRFSFLGPVLPILSKAIDTLRNKNLRKRSFTHLKVMTYYLFNFNNKIFKTLNPLTGNIDAKTFFITSCTHCNKRFRLYY